ncbi:MAG: hypothetical protein QOF58_1139 [Pseudonocardiales bacterium]|nr:hypothetical protein [Pseudonocardiales bacterium]
MIGVRKLSPGGYEYLTGSVACADRDLDAGESLSDYYLAHGYPPGQWFGKGAAALGVTGQVTREQMNALFGEGRHPDADRIQAEMIAAGHTEAEALAATKLGHRFYQYDGPDKLRSLVGAAYKQHNLDNNLPPGAPIDEATRAGIRRLVQSKAYADTHEGQQPTDNELTKWLSEQKRAMKTATSGFELVFAPPKSVSVLWALDDKHRELVVRLHRQAVLDTLAYLENNVAFTRRGDGGHAQVDVQGIAAAIFEHWDSRAGDPHLHTHVPISTKVQGPDGRWTSLDGRTILAAAVTMSEYYNSRIRDLFRENGASWTERPAGGIDLKRPTWELDGVPLELLAGFSQRASQVEQDRARRIVEFRRDHGREPTPKEMLEISKRAQYGTREAKQAPRSLAEHLLRWLGQARDMVGPEVVEDLGQRVFGGQGEDLSEIKVAELAESTLGVVSDYYSHFNPWNIEAEAHRQTAHLRVPDGGRDKLIADVVTAVLQSSDLISLEAPSLVPEPDALRRRSGQSVWVEHNSQRYTCARTLREESALASWGALTNGRRLQPATVEQALAGARALNRGRQLNRGQRDAVVSFAASGRRVQLLYAPAGAGKTTAMKVYANAVRAEGGRIFAFGPSARAAHVLAESIDARPHTLHQVTTAQLMGFAEEAFPFRRGDVLIVDEVSMAGTHTLYDVVSYALRRGADVRLVGDDKQLAAVEAGGAVRWFEHLNGAVRLREVVRFHDPAQRAASLALHAGDPSGLDYYFDQEWVSEGSRETIRDAAHRAWRADLDAGLQSLLIVPTNEDVTALNHEARALRVLRGDVDGRGRSVQLHDGTTASKGDWVVTRRNDRLKTLFGGKDFIKNGDTWDVVSVRRDGGLKLRHQVSRGTVVVPADYVAKDVEPAYCSTGNRVQGMTSRDSAHAIVTQGLSAEHLYTMITRAVHDNRIYAETQQHTIDSHQETPPELTARGVLEAALARSSAEISANEQLRNALADAESLRTLVGWHDDVALRGVEAGVDAVLTEHVPHLLDNPAAPALRQTLRTAEALGWQAQHLVPAALATGPIDGDGVDDPAALLQWRIEQRVLIDAPPAREITPTLTAINQWRGIIEHHAPAAAVEDSAWEPVWKRAAAAAAEGLDADSAITDTARWLAARPTNDPMPDHQFSADALDAALRGQRDQGAGWHPALPWLAHPNHDELVSQPQLLGYLHQMNEAIGARVAELRGNAIAEQPAWTAGLGPRPLDDPAIARRWDELAGLGAAYRDTHNITTNDPRRPLGDEPEGNGLRARAWQDLIIQWRPPTSEANTSTAPTTTVPCAVEQLRDALDPDEFLAALAADELGTYTPLDETLHHLVRRYEHSARLADEQHLDERITRVLTDRAPSTLGTKAEEALRGLLLRTHQQGWNIEQAVPDAVSLAGIDSARDPAAVLYRLVEQRVHRTEPSGTPARQDGPLPWLATADPAALEGKPELASHLHQLAHAIGQRAAQLREEVAEEQPTWSLALGPRPENPAAAARWDELAGAAAAYREAYLIRVIDPAIPLGAQPRRVDSRARAWTTLTDQWRPIVTTPEDQFASNQERIDALRDRVAEDAEDLVDDAEELTADRQDHARSIEVSEDLHRFDDAEEVGDHEDLSSGFGY